MVHTEGNTSYPPSDSKNHDVIAEESGQLSKNLFSRIKECIIQTESYLKTEQKSRPVWLHSFFVLHQNGTDHLSLQHSSHPLSCATSCLMQLYRHFANVIFWYIQELCCYSTTWKNQGRNEEEGPSGSTPHSGWSWSQDFYFHLKGCVCLCLCIFKALVDTNINLKMYF